MTRISTCLPTLLLALCATGAHADLTQTDGQVMLMPSSVATPARGSTMSQVEAKFGAPQTRHDPVGKPPIARWDYPQFSVYFENSRVIHAVVHAASAPAATATP